MENELQFVPWGDIELFHNLVRAVKFLNSKSTQIKKPDELCEEDSEDTKNLCHMIQAIQEPVAYRGKVKLHGSNGGIALLGNQIRAQSRNQFIETSGFGRIVFEKNENYFKSLTTDALDPRMTLGQITIYGEYCGPKVQKGVALSQLKFDIFAIFAIDIGGNLIIEPDDIHNFMTKGNQVRMPSNVFIIPWHMDPITMDLKSVHENACAEALAQIEREVELIDKLDPWVKDTFGIEGAGEGLVLYPVSLMENKGPYRTLRKDVFKKFGFKAKGGEHRVVVAKSSVQIDPSIAANIDAYVELMCPEPRLKQGAGEVGGYDLKKMKDFITWVTKDVEKEGKAELEASKLEWNNVKGKVGKKASNWYVEKVKEIGKQ